MQQPSPNKSKIKKNVMLQLNFQGSQYCTLDVCWELLRQNILTFLSSTVYSWDVSLFQTLKTRN